MQKGKGMSKFVIRTVPTGVKFDLKAANGQVIATSEVYDSVSACRKGIVSVKKNAATAKLEIQTEAGYQTLTNPKFILFQDKGGEFRFRLTARNGQTIAVSENYSTKAACENGIASVQKNAPKAEITED